MSRFYRAAKVPALGTKSTTEIKLHKDWSAVYHKRMFGGESMYYKCRLCNNNKRLMCYHAVPDSVIKKAKFIWDSI